MARSSLLWGSDDWSEFLDSWNLDVIRLLQRKHIEYRSPLTVETLRSGSIRRPPATEDKIKAAEHRLGALLPHSYREFLSVSNGLTVHALDAEDAFMLPVEQIGWLGDMTPDLVEAWTRFDDWVDDDTYFIYGDGQDCIHIRTEYLTSALQLTNHVDSAVVLLNPEIHDPNDEWEGWDFGNESPGAYRFRSFQELLVGLRSRTAANLSNALQFQDLLPRARNYVFADPFGHGFCFVEFMGRGYDEIAGEWRWAESPAADHSRRALDSSARSTIFNGVQRRRT